MSDPTEEGNKTVFRPSPLQGRKTGQTNFPGQQGTTPPVPQQPVWNSAAAGSAPAPSPEDARGTTALAPARAGGSVLPFASPAGDRSQDGPAPVQPPAAQTAPVKPPAIGAKSVSPAPAKRGGGAMVIKVVAAILVVCLLAFLAAKLLRPDLIPPQLRLSSAGVQTNAPTALAKTHA